MSSATFLSQIDSKRKVSRPHSFVPLTYASTLLTEDELREKEEERQHKVARAAAKQAEAERRKREREEDEAGSCKSDLLFAFFFSL